MPGILPMKMIRVGSNAQSRIAQACDRCRSKKIRCDGVRPCCTQCANVGFECKTSDKLSRRAFPRGYTESLEDRVRALETEVRELKALLDEKDEKIDMLSRIHNFSAQSRKSSISPNNTASIKTEEGSPRPREEVILVELPAAVHPSTTYNGTCTTAALIEVFEEKVRESDRTCPYISPADLMRPSHVACKAATAAASNVASVAPPRLLSDQYINIFFQEWQPLLPVLHRPTFLRLYEQYLLDPEAHSWSNNKHAIPQLFLIFEISAHSSSSKTRPATTAYEIHWRKSLSSTSSTPTITTVQSHLLAQLCYLLKADYPHLLRHRAYAVSMIHQLCLHQGHKSHSLPIFEAETRKKVFWCQYVLDKFTSAATGTPQLLHESDISVEYPADVDDENISTHGISPALPGELTKISSAFALFRVSRILAKSLQHLYPAKSSYQLSLTKLHSLSDELDQWQEELPDHLRLRFCNDKPATNLISCRSPLLSLAYFYVRSLIHRPLLCHGSGNAASAATIVLAAAAKHEIQVLDLLDERSMNYTFPLSKQDILLNAGFAILWQSFGLDKDSKLIKDNQRSITLLIGKLARTNPSVSSEFHKIASSFMPSPSPKSSYIDLNHDSVTSGVASSMPAPPNNKPKSTRKQLQAMASRLSSFNGKSKNEDGIRRASMSQPRVYMSASPDARANSTVSLSSTRSAPALPTPDMSVPGTVVNTQNASAVNLDYFPFSDDVIDCISSNSSSTMLPPQKISSTLNMQGCWDHVPSNLVPNSPDMFNTTISPSTLNQPTPLPVVMNDWSNDLWQISPYDIEPRGKTAHSLQSFSEESLTSCDEILFSAAGSHNGSTSTTDTLEIPGLHTTNNDSFKGIAMPTTNDFDFHEIEA